jgi:hypothetical protein
MISRVVTDATQTSIYMHQWYITAANVEVANEPAQELLVCETTQSTATPPVVTPAGEACGLWSNINMLNSVTTNGFAVGPSRITNVTTYVGRGQYGGEFRPGRYQNEDVTGAYTSVAGDTLMKFSEFLVVPEGCTW